MDNFDYWRDLLEADPDQLQQGQLADLWQMGIEANSLAINPLFRFLLASVKDHYISAMTSDENDNVDSLRSIRAGLKNIDVLTQVLLDIAFKADRARTRVEGVQKE